MPRWQGKSKGSPLGYRIIIFVCSTFGVLPAYFVLRFVALYYFFFSRESTNTIYRYFRDRVGFGASKSRMKVYRNYYVFAQTLLDKMIVMAGIKNHFTFEFDGESNLKKIVEGGRGGILLSAHLGNWEIAGHLLKRLNTRINVVMYDGEHRAIKDYLESVSGGRNLNVIVVKEDLSHVYAISDALQKNELICLHADRFLEGTKTVVKKFMNADARFPEGPFVLAGTFKVPVSIVFAFKDSASHYHLYGSQTIQRDAGEEKHEFVSRLLNTYIGQVEEKVKRYPEQWFNYYNFWE